MRVSCLEKVCAIQQATMSADVNKKDDADVSSFTRLAKLEVVLDELMF